MQILKILFFLFCFSNVIAFGQNTIPAKPRFGYQQEFIAKNFLLTKKNIQFNTTKQVDSLLKAIKMSWEEFVSDSLVNQMALTKEVWDNLDAYSYYWTIINFAEHQQINDAISFYLYKNYMLPSLQKDVEFVVSKSSLINERLIWAGSLENTLI